jgi:hypothetical protein
MASKSGLPGTDVFVRFFSLSDHRVLLIEAVNLKDRLG